MYILVHALTPTHKNVLKLYEMNLKTIQRTGFLKVEKYNVFYIDRNLNGRILNRFILVPMLWKYHEASPHSDAYIYWQSL